MQSNDYRVNFRLLHAEKNLPDPLMHAMNSSMPHTSMSYDSRKAQGGRVNWEKRGRAYNVMSTNY